MTTACSPDLVAQHPHSLRPDHFNRPRDAKMTDSQLAAVADQVLQKIATVAFDLAASCSITATQVAGMIVSFLYAHPDATPRFLEAGASVLLEEGRSWSSHSFEALAAVAAVHVGAGQ